MRSTRPVEEEIDAPMLFVPWLALTPSKRRVRAMELRVWRLVSALLSVPACGGTLDAGWDEPKGSLPVDERNPVILCNDGAFDNWQGEHAVLFARAGGPSLTGIVINDGWPWTELDENLAGWQQMLARARDSGIEGLPEPISSSGPALVRPDNDDIDATSPNGSEGALFIVERSRELSRPGRPLVVVTGGRLTDVADAYLLDHSLPERVVVVSALGTTKTDGAAMGLPNGQLDTWANIIVAQKFEYVQVTGYSYDLNSDILSGDLAEFPVNPFLSWVAGKQARVENVTDQVALFVVAMPEVVETMVAVEHSGEDEEGIPLLTSASGGSAHVITSIDLDAVAERLRSILLEPSTFAVE